MPVYQQGAAVDRRRRYRRTVGATTESGDTSSQREDPPVSIIEKAGEVDCQSGGRGGVSSKTLALHTVFSVMIDSGLPLIQCRRSRRNSRRKRTSNVLEKVREDVAEAPG
jgi:hypothetical protein